MAYLRRSDFQRESVARTTEERRLDFGSEGGRARPRGREAASRCEHCLRRLDASGDAANLFGRG